MRYRILITEQAHEELRSSCSWWAENRSPPQAERWYNGFVEAMLSLADNPQRCPPVPEQDDIPFEARQLVFGLGRRPTHRAVFMVHSDQVLVLRVRHLAQELLSAEDFGPQ